MTAVIVLFVAGCILILAEFFLPGLVLGVLGLLLIIASGTMGVMNHPEYALFIVVAETLGLVGMIILGLYLITSTPLSRLLVLEDTLSSEDGYTSPKMDPALKGQIAIAHTALRPAGTIMLNEERIDAVSDGTFIDAGSNVHVIQVEGHRVVVELAEDGAAEGGAA